MKKTLLILMALASLIIPAHAQLGWTREQCDATFGKATAGNTPNSFVYYLENHITVRCQFGGYHNPFNDSGKVYTFVVY